MIRTIAAMMSFTASGQLLSFFFLTLDLLVPLPFLTGRFFGGIFDLGGTPANVRKMII